MIDGERLELSRQVRIRGNARKLQAILLLSHGSLWGWKSRFRPWLAYLAGIGTISTPQTTLS